MARKRPQLAALLETARQRKALSQERLARLCGNVSQPTAHRWLAGSATPQDCYLVLLSDLLGVPLAEIAAADEPDPRRAQAALLRLLELRDAMRGGPPALDAIQALYEQAVAVRVAGAVAESLALTASLLAWLDAQAGRSPAAQRAALLLKARIWDEQGWALRDSAPAARIPALAEDLSARLRSVWEPLDEPDIYGRDLAQRGHALYLQGDSGRSAVRLNQALEWLATPVTRLAAHGLLCRAAGALADRRTVERQEQAILRLLEAGGAPWALPRPDMVCVGHYSIAQAYGALGDRRALPALEQAMAAYRQCALQGVRAPFRQITLALIELELAGRFALDPPGLAARAAEARRLSADHGYAWTGPAEPA